MADSSAMRQRIRRNTGQNYINRWSAVKLWYITVGIVATLLSISLSIGFAQSLSFDNQVGNIGETVSFTMRVNNAPSEVDAFGFDVIYNPEVLRYEGDYSGGELLSGFNFFQVNKLKPGQARVAGFSIKNQIKAGSSGRMVTLNFTVIKPGNASLTVANQVDDVAGWPTQPGLFENLSVQEGMNQIEKSSSQPVTGPTGVGSQQPIAPQVEEMASQTVPQVSPDSSEERPTESSQPATVETASRPSDAQPATNPSSASSSRPSQSQTTSVPPQLPIPVVIMPPTVSGQTENTVSTQPQPSSRANPDIQAVERQTPPEVTVPSQASQAIAPPQVGRSIDQQSGAPSQTENKTMAKPVLPKVTAEQQRVSPGNNTTPQMTAGLVVPQERATPPSESTSERAQAPNRSVSVENRGGTVPNAKPLPEAGLLSQTSRLVLLVGAVVMLCAVGVLLVSLRSR